MLKTEANDDKPVVASDRAPTKDATLHEIVIVGGGAAGLELATGLGNTRETQESSDHARRQSARASLETASTFVQQAASISTSMRSITLPKRIGII